MDSGIIIMMMSVSIFLGLMALGGFLWAVKSGQFDNEDKFLNATKYDGEDELNDAVALEKKKEMYKKNYKPVD